MRSCLVLVLALVSACKDPPKQPPATAASGSAVGSAGSGTTRVPVGSGSAQVDRKPIELPPLSGKPAPKTKEKLTKAQLEVLSKLEFVSFVRDLRKLDEGFVNVKYMTKDRPKISVTVTVLPCGKCPPLTAEKWRAEKEGLMVTLAPELRDRPDTTFEIGESTLGGEKVIYVYQLGQYFGKDEVGNPMGTYSNAYILHHHDGVNQIRIVAEYADDPVASKEDMARAVPREHLERIATSFLDSFVQRFVQ